MGPEGKILIIGAGKSGISSACLLLRNGYQAEIYDGNEKLDVEALRGKSPLLKDIPVYLGKIPEKDMDQITEAVISPGVSPEIPLVQELEGKGKKIIGEIELAYHFAKGKIIGITGTNGKTTTTSLVGEILKKKYKDVQVAGNIGNPFTDVADQTKEDTVSVLELSSFQLETVDTFHADVSAILNITPDHLDRHHTMENYAACKMRVTNRQTKQDTCVLNGANEYTAEFAGKCPAHVVLFSSEEELKDGYFLRDGAILHAEGGKEEKVFSLTDTTLIGTCNAENIMAAIAICRAMDVPMEEIADAIKAFRAVPHRIEYVATKRGVRFYNDSKGTNPDAAIQAIKAMDAKTCLIAGGYDKEIPFDDWIKAFDGKVKKLVLLGQTAQIIADTAKKYGFTNIAFAGSLEEAVKVSYESAEPGEIVLLSPACASWGMFPNYEVRGDMFKDYVRTLAE